jgi:hypothetical protein
MKVMLASTLKVETSISSTNAVASAVRIMPGAARVAMVGANLFNSLKGK